MSESSFDSNRNTIVYNPDLLSKEQLTQIFVARADILGRILEDLRLSGPGRRQQHKLIVGQRGMGKSTLLRRIQYAVEDSPELNPRFLSLSFPEEQYNVTRLSDFYLNCIDALADQLERESLLPGKRVHLSLLAGAYSTRQSSE